MLVVSILENPPEQDKYETLKSQLLKTFGLSEAKRAHQLLTLQRLSDSKPSELMDKMLALLGNNKPDFLFRHLFLNQLPTHVQAAFVGRTGRLLFIQNTISGWRFLSDMGTQTSILPALRVDMLGGEYGPPLTTANSTPIRTYGTWNVELCFRVQHFNWEFITAKVTFPFLSADFLCTYGLLVDVKGRRLVNAETFCSLCLYT